MRCSRTFAPSCMPIPANRWISSGSFATSEPCPRRPEAWERPDIDDIGPFFVCRRSRQAGFEQNLYDDRKAFRVGDIITITLNEKTQASKKANSDIQKDSKTKMGLTSLFGSGITTNNPIGGGDLSLSAEYGGSRDAKGDSQAGQSNSLTGSITVTVAEVLPNGILSVRGEKWMTLNTGNELVRIAGLVRADDIATDNTVSSTRVADARITYSGTGAFADASQPGWLDRFFLSPLWPF
ncbi:flagellar basal body L-ring protein FlgH [Pseudomonas aeruginosa]|uniref:flagellar basal body L-ring protein FlgH n=4 Tax=Gammaproteobacteria TaxID=1236 RepID=UPI0039C3CD71